MSILTIEQALQGVDSSFRDKIIASYKEIKNRYSKSLYNLEYDSTGLSVGKFCETILRFLQKRLTGSNTPFGSKINNFDDECRNLSKTPQSAGKESERVIIPRALQFLYTLRNKRGIGHVGGDVEANKIDTETIVRVSDWVICELIRINHTLSLEEAQAIVDSISEKSIPEIWNVGGKKRVLSNGLETKEKLLLLLYQSTENYEFAEDLYKWVEYSDYSMFKRTVLSPLHKKKLIEFDKETGIVHISPIGTLEVEQIIIPKTRS